MTDELLIAALNRLSTAIESVVLTALDNRGAFPQTNGDPYPASIPLLAEERIPLPPMHAPAVPTSAGCPIHNVSWKLVPAGVSKRTGNSYDAFLACPTAGCTQRPPR